MDPESIIEPIAPPLWKRALCYVLMAIGGAIGWTGVLWPLFFGGPQWAWMLLAPSGALFAIAEGLEDPVRYRWRDRGGPIIDVTPRPRRGWLRWLAIGSVALIAYGVGAWRALGTLEAEDVRIQLSAEYSRGYEQGFADGQGSNEAVKADLTRSFKAGYERGLAIGRSGVLDDQQ